MNHDEKKPVLLFDLGGVIMDIKRDNCVSALRELGMPHPENYLGDYAQTGVFRLIEEGKITPAQFRDQLRRDLPAGVTDEQIDKAFNAFLTGIPLHRLRFLEQLRQKGYRIYLLSNTNPIMWNSRIAEEFRKDGHDISYYFLGCETSFEAHCCKPDPEIFLDTLRRFSLEASEVLFLDDSADNCAAAARLGFRTLCVLPGQDFTQLLANF